MECLSNDVLLLCLEFMDIRAILMCRQVCARLHMLIDSSGLLQYRIQLYASNMTDFVPRVASLDICLERLLQYRQRWHHLEWIAKEDIPCALKHAEDLPTLGNVIKVRGSTLVMFSCSTRTLHVVQLPSKTRGVSPVRWEWVFPGPRRLINFAFDSAQDLLLCLEVRNPIDRASKLQLHAFSLENGNSHPRGGRMSLHEVPSQVITASFMTVECQHIAFFRPDEPRTHPHARIMVWDWQKGNNILDINTPGGPGGECVFLSERYILVGEVRKNPHKAYLNVIDILNPTDPVLCKFQLPRLANFEQSHIHVASSRRVPVPPRSQGLFVGDPTDKIIFVSILVKEILSLFVLASRLIGLAETRPARSGEVIRWEEWGPDSARFMNFNDEDLDPDTGVRVEIVGTRAFMIERSKLTLYDFNQKLITQDLAKGEASDNLVIQATDSSDWASFEQEVTTCLPYRFIRAAMPREDVRRWINMYASEDGILVEPEMEDGHGKTLEFYSI